MARGCSDPIVEAQEIEARDGVPGDHRRREVDRVKRTDGFTWKRPPGPLDNFSSDPHHVPSCGRRVQVRVPVGPLSLRQVTQRGCADDDVIALEQGEV